MHYKKLWLTFLLFFIYLNNFFGQNIGGVINLYQPVTAIDYCTNSVVATAPTGFSVGDTVVLIQMKGAIIDSTNTANYGSITNMNNAGNYEFNEIQQINGNTIVFKYTLLKQYSPSNGSVQIIRVPYFVNPNVTTTLTSPAWNGLTGGVVILNAIDTVTLNADIDVSTLGFRGGAHMTGPSCASGFVTTTNYFHNPFTFDAGLKGEGIATQYTQIQMGGKGALANGGGGGNNHNAGGGGGSNFSVAGQGGQKVSGIFSCPGVNPGIGGIAMTYTNVLNKIFMGGGGGAGHDNNNLGIAGANGGGIIIIKANRLIANNHFLKSNGGNALLADGDGGSGGGAGGTILFAVNNLVGNLNVETNGGKGSDQNNAGMAFCIGPGGGGSGGMFWYKGAAMPTLASLTQTGGANGTTINSNCSCVGGLGSTNGATPGNNGGTLNNLNVSIASVLNTSSLLNVSASTDSICLGNSANLNVSGASSYTWTPAATLSCSNCSNPIATPIATTTYFVSATNALGCALTDSIIITIVTKPNINITLSSDTICFGNSLSILPNVITPAANYSWTPISNLSCTNCVNTIASNSVTTTYFLTSSNGTCTDLDSIKIIVLPKLNIGSLANHTICSGDSILLSINGLNKNLQWNPNINISCTTCANPTVWPSSTTTYTVIIDSAMACSDTVNTIITVNTSPNINIANGNQTICTSYSLNINPTVVTAATNYTWSPSLSLSCTNCLNTVATPSATTTYTLVSQLGSCYDTDKIILNVIPNTVAVTNNDTTICKGKSVSLVASGGTTYLWYPNTALSCFLCQNTIATPTVTTTYSVIAINGNCVDTEQVVINVNPMPAISLPLRDTICLGNSLNLNPNISIAANTYQWNPNSTLSCTACISPIANPTITTTYYLHSAVNTCIDQDSIVVYVEHIDTTFIKNYTICKGSSVSLQSSAALSYSWSNATTLSCSNCANPVASPTSTTTYILTETTNNCNKSFTIIVTVLPKPTIQLGLDTNICKGTSINLTSVINTASSFIWQPSTNLSCANCATTIATPSVTTTYSLIGNLGICSDTDAIIITVDTIPNANAGNDINICIGQSTILTASASANYTWSPNSNLSCTACAAPVASPTATTTYQVLVNNNNCKDSDVVIVFVNAYPTVFAGNDLSICTGQSVTLNGSTNASVYNWMPNNVACNICLQTLTSPTVTTTFILSANNNNCITTDSITVFVTQPFNIITSGDTGICIGSSVLLNATGGSNFLWQPSGSLSCSACNQPLATPTSTTTYTVINNSLSNCNDTAYVKVEVYPYLNVIAKSDTTIESGKSVDLYALGTPCNYCWTENFQNNCIGTVATITVSPTITTTYILLATAPDYCPSSDTVIVKVFFDPTLAIPNSFSPNDDGISDYFFPVLGSQNLVVFKIFNRWGQLVFQTNDKNSKGWDGRFKGVLQPMDTYVYYLELNDTSPIIHKGDIILIK